VCIQQRRSVLNIDICAVRRGIVKGQGTVWITPDVKFYTPGSMQ
jgi:hypothetical protein